ncbi:hypothetical protein LJC42_08395 [Eubacteriales bacterium OttesenSCG-928-K08]|nr:hypothetical protein [Eubacteriales bacterium OttesenSCG-928-K08]
MNEFFTWAVLATYAGATLATALITELLKNFSFIAKLNTRGVSYLVALIVLLTAGAGLGTLSWGSAGLCVINAVVVALASNGAFDALSMNRK